MNIRNLTRCIAVAGALVVAGGGLWHSRRIAGASAADPVTADRDMAASSDSASPRKVEVVRPVRASMSRRLDVPATIEAFETADLYARISGYVREVRVDIGDVVKKDEVLAVIDVPEVVDDLHQAEAAVQIARAEHNRNNAELALRQVTFDRKKELRAANAIPDQELDQSRGELEVSRAQAALAQAKISGAEAAASRLRTLVEYATIKSPFEGVIARRTVDRGDLAQSTPSGQAMPLFTVQRVDQLRIFIDAPETDVMYIRPGIAAQITPYGMKDKSFGGKVARIASSLNPNTRTMRTEIDLTNPDGVLMHGMYAQVALKLDERANALTIPAAAVLTEGPQAYVLTVNNNHVARADILIGLDDGIRVEVKKGLDDNALVVLAGKGLVSDGSPVRPVLRDTLGGS